MDKHTCSAANPTVTPVPSSVGYAVGLSTGCSVGVRTEQYCTLLKLVVAATVPFVVTGGV